LNSWEGATPEARQAYVGGDSFDEYYNKTPKELTNLRHDTNEVIDCMMDALTNQQPKADYIPDFTSRVLACIFEILPIHWVDSIVLFRKETGNRI